MTPFTLGVVMLDTRFRRWPGDIGNPATWDCRVLYRVVPGATVGEVPGLRDARWLAPFRDAAVALAAEGADLVATSCGFLLPHQAAIAAACPVPVATSALLQGPIIRAVLAPGSRVGVLTYDASALGTGHLETAGLPADTPVAAPGGPFRAAIEAAEETGFEAQQAAVLEAADRLMGAGRVGAILLECTNLAPFSAAIAARCGVPVWDIVTLVRWMRAGLRPRLWRDRGPAR